jgi:hypothetical protein
MADSALVIKANYQYSLEDIEVLIRWDYMQNPDNCHFVDNRELSAES